MKLTEAIKQLNVKTLITKKKWIDSYLVKNGNYLDYSAGLPDFGSVTTGYEISIQDLKANDWHVISYKDAVEQLFSKYHSNTQLKKWIEGYKDVIICSQFGYINFSPTGYASGKYFSFDLDSENEIYIKIYGTLSGNKFRKTKNSYEALLILKNMEKYYKQLGIANV